MALLWYDGFDTYESNGTDYYKGGFIAIGTSNLPNVVTDVGDGRHGYGKYLVTQAAGLSGFSTPAFPAMNTFILGFALKIQTSASLGQISPLLRIFSCSDEQCDIYLSGGTLIPALYVGGSLVKTGTGSLDFNKWNFIELKMTIHDSTGSIELRKDGVPILTGSSLDTRAGSTFTGATSFVFSNTSLIAQHWSLCIDDMYLCDTSGGIHDDFLGDCMSLTRLVNADTAQVDFTCSSGSDHYALVDDPMHDDDSTYVESVTDGQYDILEVEDLPANTTEVLAVAVETWCKLEEAGDTFVINMLNSGGTEYAAADGGLGVEPFYHPRRSYWEKDPKTDAAWTVDNANAIKIGYKIDVK